MIKEARSINLSLHYLEQVIICLKDTRDHQHQHQHQSSNLKTNKERRHSFASIQEVKANKKYVNSPPESQLEIPKHAVVANKSEHTHSLPQFFID
jgi:hypothetical protein